MSYEFPCKDCERKSICNHIIDHCDKFKSVFCNPDQLKIIHEMPINKICPYCGSNVELELKNYIENYTCTVCKFTMPHNSDLKDKLNNWIKILK